MPEQEEAAASGAPGELTDAGAEEWLGTSAVGTFLRDSCEGLFEEAMQLKDKPGPEKAPYQHMYKARETFVVLLAELARHRQASADTYSEAERQCTTSRQSKRRLPRWLTAHLTTVRSPIPLLVPPPPFASSPAHGLQTLRMCNCWFATTWVQTIATRKSRRQARSTSTKWWMPQLRRSPSGGQPRASPR